MKAAFHLIFQLVPGWLRLPVFVGLAYLVFGLIFAVGVLLTQLLGWVIALAIVCWVVVCVAVPVRTGRLSLPGVLAPFFEWVTNLGGPTAAQPTSQSLSIPRTSRATNQNRGAVRTQAVAKVERLYGNNRAKQKLEDLITVATAAVARGARGLGTLAPASLVAIYGPPGTGKTEMALGFIGLLYAAKAIATPNALRIESRDLIDSGAGSAAQAAEENATDALDGVLLMDDAEWLAQRKGDFTAEIGRAFLHVADTNPGRLLVVITGGPTLREQLLDDPDLTRVWLGKWAVERVELEDLSPEDLLQVLADMSQRANVLIPADARQLATRHLAEERARMGTHFDNVFAVQRLFNRAWAQAQARGVPEGALTVTRADVAAAVS